MSRERGLVEPEALDGTPNVMEIVVGDRDEELIKELR